jgi:endonuclease YncB( thermonuclease family)
MKKILALLLLLSLPAYAQEPSAPAAPPERIVRPMQAVDPVTLRAEGVTIRLWGIQPAETKETPLALRALDLLDAMTDRQMVNCKIVGGAIPSLVGQCQAQSGEDIALSLLSAGLVVTDRRQTYGTVLATGYARAQEEARLKARGVWAFTAETAEDAPPVPKWLRPYFATLLPLALLFGPFLGLVIAALALHFGLRRIGLRQEETQQESRAREAALQGREVNILSATLENELSDNKDKVEAYLAIYGDMLSALKDPAAAKRYQQAGDIVQKHPAFSRTVFDASVGKLSLLDVKVSGTVSRVYARLPREAEYITLDPDVPLDTAVKLVEKVIEGASVLVPEIEKAIQSLRAATGP